MMPSVLSRYVLIHTIRSLVIAFMVVTSIIMLVDFVEANRDLGADTNASSFQLLALTAMKTPSLIEQTIPFVVLFGMMGAIHGMNRRSELIVMRASGQSAWTILRPVIILAGILGFLWALILNPLAASLYDSYEVNSASWLGEGTRIFDEDIWLREGRDGEQLIIQADSFDLASRSLIDATVLIMSMETDGRTRFSRRFDAERMELLPQGYWQLFSVTENAPGEATQTHSALSLPTRIDMDTLQQQVERTERSAFWQMPATIAENERAGFSARGLKLEFNRLLALPVMLIAMTFIAAGVSMSLTREGGTLRLLITGAALGFAVFFADSLVSAFGEVAIIPVVPAAWAVPIIVLLLGISHLAKIEDG